MAVLEMWTGYALQLQSNSETVQHVIVQRPRTSVRRVAFHAGLLIMTMQSIMRRSLYMSPYKIQSHQHMSEVANHICWNFANAMLQLLVEGEIDNVQFSGAIYFQFDGFVNNLNWRIWGAENTNDVVPSSLLTPKLMIQAAIFSKE